MSPRHFPSISLQADVTQAPEPALLQRRRLLRQLGHLTGMTALGAMPTAWGQNLTIVPTDPPRTLPPLAAEFADQVHPRLAVPEAEQWAYYYSRS